MWKMLIYSAIFVILVGNSAFNFTTLYEYGEKSTFLIYLHKLWKALIYIVSIGRGRRD